MIQEQNIANYILYEVKKLVEEEKELKRKQDLRKFMGRGLNG